MSLFSRLPRRVRVVEVGPRDGLQNEAATLPAEAKVRFVELLADAGLPVVEVTSFVSPRAIPQLRDADQVLPAVRRRPGVRYPVLVPNLRGLERARAAGADAICVFTAASEEFARRNINMSIAESLRAFAPVLAQARAEGMWTRGYVSTAFGCPYAGAIDPAAVVDVSLRLLELGCEEVSIGDTIGVATPVSTERVAAALLERIGRERIALHLHDTYERALANVTVGLQLGIATYDSSAGGLGGCPFAPGAAGNLATERLVGPLDALGVETGVSLEALRRASAYLRAALAAAAGAS